LLPLQQHAPVAADDRVICSRPIADVRRLSAVLAPAGLPETSGVPRISSQEGHGARVDEIGQESHKFLRKYN